MKTLNRMEKEMRSLIRKTQKKVQNAGGSAQDHPSVEASERSQHSGEQFRDRAGEHDPLLQDMTHDEIFREMKRRDF